LLPASAGLATLFTLVSELGKPDRGVGSARVAPAVLV
jgi:hypothetical protein